LVTSKELISYFSLTYLHYINIYTFGNFFYAVQLILLSRYMFTLFLVITFPGNLTHELQESKYLKHMIIVSHTSNIYIQMKYTSCLYDAFSFCRSTRLVMCFYMSSGVTKNLRKRIRQSASLRVREL